MNSEHKTPTPADDDDARYIVPRVVVPGCVAIFVRAPACGNIETTRAVEFIDDTGRVLLRAIAAVPVEYWPRGISFRLVPGVGGAP